MRYSIIKINESSIYQLDVPEELEIHTSNGTFVYKSQNVYRDGLQIRTVYSKDEEKNHLKDLYIDEPQNLYLIFNFHISDVVEKILIDVTYGKTQKFEFSIQRPDILKVSNFDGHFSRFDKDSRFSFSDESISSLLNCLNKVGFQFTEKHFEFMNKYPNSYQSHFESIKLTPFFNNGSMLIIDNHEPNKSGGYVVNLMNYLRSRGINFFITTSPTEADSLIKTENIVGVLSAGSDYRITSPRSEEEQVLSHKILKEFRKPVLAMCYGFQSMANFYGSKIVDSKDFFHDHISLSYWKKDCPIFQNINLDEHQFSVSFHDIVSECPKGFDVIATYDKYILGIQSDKLMRWGLAFHPEDIERTYPILDNFIEICRSKISDDSEVLKFSTYFERYLVK